MVAAVFSTVLFSLISEASFCPPPSITADQITAVVSAAVKPTGDDPARAHNMNFFELHLARLDSEIAEYSDTQRKGSYTPWILTQNQIILTLKIQEQKRLKELYEKYKRGELPAIHGQKISDIVMLKYLVGDPITNMGHVSVQSLDKDGLLVTTQKFESGPKRNLIAQQIKAKQQLISDFNDIIIPRGLFMDKRDHGFNFKLRAQLWPYLVEALKYAPQSDDELRKWAKSSPESTEILRDLRLLESPEEKRKYLLETWLFAQNPSLALILKADKKANISEDELASQAGPALLSFAIPKEQLQSDLQFLKSIPKKERTDSEASLSISRRRRALVIGDIKNDSELKIIERLNDLNKNQAFIGTGHFAESARKLSKPAQLYLILSGDAPFSDSGNSPEAIELEALMMKTLLPLTSFPVGSPQRRLLAASKALEFTAGKPKAADPEISRQDSKEDSEESSPEDIDIKPANKFDHKTPLSVSEIKKALGIPVSSKPDWTRGVDFSKEYTSPKLQGSATSEPSFACQTYAVIADLEMELKKKSRWGGIPEISIPYSYGLTLAKAHLGNIPDNLYGAMFKKAREKTPLVLPGEVSAIMDTGASLMDALEANSENFTVDAGAAPKNDKGEAFFPESITEFSKTIARGYTKGHDKYKIEDFVVLNDAGTRSPEFLDLILKMVKEKKMPIVTTSTDARTIVENWFRPAPGQIGHVLNIVGYGMKTSAFDAKEKPTFIVRDSFVTEPIHYYVSAEELMPFITGVGKITAVKEETGFLGAKPKSQK